MRSLYLRLAGPLQSWAQSRATGNITMTLPYPSRTGVNGLIGAALGAPHGEIPAWVEALTIRLRCDDTGSIIDEFQTINPRDEDREYQARIYQAITGRRLTGKQIFTPDARGMTSVIQRTLISGGEFILEIETGNHHDELVGALRNPVYTPYLGKKAFGPTFPFFLGVGESGLLDTLPRCVVHQPKRYTYASMNDNTDERVELMTLIDSNRLDTSYITVPTMDRPEWLNHIQGALVRAAS